MSDGWTENFRCDTNEDMEKTYRIGDVARICGVTVRTVRYYEDLGLLKSKSRTEGGQRVYTESDIVYLNRILELKELDFSLDEIGHVIKLGPGDSDGSQRRSALLKEYRYKLSAALERQAALEKRISDLSWHIRQLESGINWQECPGSACASCAFRDKCRFFRKPATLEN